MPGWWINEPRSDMIVIMLHPHVAELLARSDREVSLRDGQRVFGVGEPVRYLFVVREGVVKMVRRHLSGAALVLQRVPRDALVAEASLFAQRYHCEAVAEGPTRVARIPKAAVLQQSMQDVRWLQDYAVHLASEVQRARGRAELLSFRRVGERLDAWFTLNGSEMPERGRWAAWADELGVTPEALYRELARRRQ
jgi:CRP/FNR family transcriptional regulator, dissimilatory nitrate respiration regulator